MKTHKTFTLIPQRSFDAYVSSRPSLNEVMCALIVNPIAAEDSAEMFGLGLPHSLSDFRTQNSLMGVEAALQTASTWLLTQDSISSALYELSLWDRWLAMWCAIPIGMRAMSYRECASCWYALVVAEHWQISGHLSDELFGRAKSALGDLYRNNYDSNSVALRMSGMLGAIASAPGDRPEPIADGLRGAVRSTIMLFVPSLPGENDEDLMDRAERLESPSLLVSASDRILSFPR